MVIVMTKKERALGCVEALKKEFPDAVCSLRSHNAFQLLVATRLSARVPTRGSTS